MNYRRFHQIACSLAFNDKGEAASYTVAVDSHGAAWEYDGANKRWVQMPDLPQTLDTTFPSPESPKPRGAEVPLG